MKLNIYTVEHVGYQVINKSCKFIFVNFCLSRSAHSAEEIAEFKYQLAEFKMEKKDNIGNLTCVLADMGVLDGNLDINMRFYTHDAWNNVRQKTNTTCRWHFLLNIYLYILL